MKTGLLIGLLGLLVGGCVSPPVNYYYGAYSRSLYRSKKDNTPESLAKHRDVLLDIISTSERRGIKVPPGIYFEYGYLLAKEGSPEAERYFGMEVKTYPESERFVSFVRAQLKGKS